MAARNLSGVDERIPVLITIRSFVKCGIAVLTTGERYNEINILVSTGHSSDNEDLIWFYDESDEE